MAAIALMTSYDLKNSKKLSFANWISNISPTETPFASMTGKEAISQTKFSWQTDVLPVVKKTNAVAEGSKPVDDDCFATKVVNNYTQIFRRGASVSDTANRVQYYGRGQEIGYQMEKASLELKRDIEKALLWNHEGEERGTSKVGKTAGFLGLVGDIKTVDSPETLTAIKAFQEKGTSATADEKKYWDHDTNAITVFQTRGKGLSEIDVFDMTYNMYMANSKANIIMFHPKHAHFFGLMTMTAGIAGELDRIRMFKSMEDTLNTEVDTIVDPLGQRYALVPNRLMPEDYIYFFNPADWTQMILRAPKKIQLAKQGSSQEWMIETEIGLRHRNPYASGVLKVA